MGASLAIDGRIVTDSYTKMLNPTYCAASKSSSSVKPWLRIDLQNVYLISEIIVTFLGINGRGAEIRVGSNASPSNDSNDNLLCGTVNNYSGDGKVATQRAVKCEERLWGRYVHVQRQDTGNLEICEVDIYTG